MDMVKRHLFFILCGVAGAAGIGLAITGSGAMPEVAKEMEGAAGLYQDLSGLRSSGVNERMLDAAQDRIDRILGDRDAIMDRAGSMYGYEPLVDSVFPNGDANSRRAFRTAYNEQMAELVKSLNVGVPATEAEIQAMASRINDENFKRKLQGETEPIDAGPAFDAAGVLQPAGARADAVSRAHIAAAQRIYCYAIDYSTLSLADWDKSAFDFAYQMIDSGTVDAPEPADTWWAQVRFWIQRDVIKVIASLNSEAAGVAKKNNQDRWVAIMPVKEIVSIRFSQGYVQPGEDEFLGSAPGGDDPAYPAAAQRSTFTQSASDTFADVMQFTLKLVMDQRDIPQLVSRISAGGFHNPLRIAYKAIPPNRKMQGKIYGPEPAVSVVLDFETPMVGDVFRRWIPQAVCEELEIDCPQPEGEEADQG
jgi:hypothetical protein